MTQFADVPVLPDFPDGLADWVCEAFPNDDNQVDGFIVALIALAVALPVTYVLQTCFEIANDNEAPESWLEWVGWRKLVFGPAAHRRWHYTGGPQPVRHVRWFVRSARAEADAEGEDEEGCADKREGPEEDAHAADEERDGADGSRSESGGSTSSSVRSARALMRYKRTVMALGLGGTFFCWAIFAWFIFTYGMLLYKLLGDEGQASFARSWGISYAVGAASEWQDIVKEAIKGAFVLAVLERLLMTRNVNWLEVRDGCSKRVC